MFCVLQTVNMSCSNSFRDLKPGHWLGRFGIPTAGCWMCIQMFPCWECCKVWGWGKMGGNEIPSMCAYLFVYIGKWGVTVFIYVYIHTCIYANYIYICNVYSCANIHKYIPLYICIHSHYFHGTFQDLSFCHIFCFLVCWCIDLT